MFRTKVKTKEETEKLLEEINLKFKIEMTQKEEVAVKKLSEMFGKNKLKSYPTLTNQSLEQAERKLKR